MDLEIDELIEEYYDFSERGMYIWKFGMFMMNMATLQGKQ